MREAVVGDRIDQYQLTELLSRGATTAVFRAVDTTSGAPVALKIPHAADGSGEDERMRREEEMGRRLEHPRIARVFTPRARSRAYLAMELVDGRSLRSLMQEAGPLPREAVLRVARQICDALSYVHSKGIVHRDLKPENVLVDRAGDVKILDFGIAQGPTRKALRPGRAPLEGTPDYVAPEQIEGRRADARTDVYALGTILYEMLTGNLPYDAADAAAFLRAKVADDPRLPSYHVPGFDPSLEAVLLKSIERDPRQRYHSAARMRADLDDPGAVMRRSVDPRRRRLAASLAVVAVLLGLASLIWLTGRYSGDPGRGSAAVERSE